MIFTFHPNAIIKTLKKVTLTVLLFVFYASKAQTTIWSENFEGCTNNAVIESGGCGWSTYATKAVVDPDDDVDESNDGNNTSTKTVIPIH